MRHTNSGVDQHRRYTAFGDQRAGDTLATLDTTYNYGGQMDDGTGLVYMNARYYDPNIGHFISPDSIIPDPSNVLDYNRYLYSRGNPVKYNDPTGHYTQGVTQSVITIPLGILLKEVGYQVK